MQQLLGGAIEDLDRWRQTAEASAIPSHRLANIRDKLCALQNCGSVSLLRTGIEHVQASMTLAGIPASALTATFHRLATDVEERLKTGRIIKTCDECGSLYFAETSPMASLCPECSSILYGYEPCKHTFAAGRCSRCHWDGSSGWRPAPHKES